ncbi:hypothetical protein KDA_42590 [Dictyobacter alpinus]|uniref:Peptidase S53 domain-containing protein n=2 Tax=Dictyobacter alpinus TaxID=2014873 RepID=A0A402BBQ1_9CHLR|nr:hypothetical protein KDA_42590 [Dictyobacter alpinus]
MILMCSAIVLLLFSDLSPLTAMAHPRSIERPYMQGKRLPGHAVPLLNNLKPLGHTDKNQPLRLSVVLRLRDEPGLDALIASQDDPTSPFYRHYLNSQEFNSSFAPTQATVDEISTYLRQQGFQITSISPNHVLIDVSTTVATAEHVFDVTFYDYQLRTRVVYAPNIDPVVPDSLINAIQTIVGLNDIALYHPNYIQSNHQPLYPHAGPGGGFTPDELRAAYNVQPLIDAKMDGTGQTVGLFELDGYDPADIHAYRQRYKLGALHASNVLLEGASDTPGKNALAATLDMEVISALAPGASQKIYLGSNTAVGINDTYNRIVTDNVAKVISVSWGECELASSAARLDALNTIFKQGAVQGQSFFVASGTSGAYDCVDDSQQQVLAVDSPASSPYAVGVGGTTLHTDAKGGYVSETAWSDPSSKGMGSGGGKSVHFMRPTYQHGPNLSDPARLVPDVSANANPASSYSIYLTTGKTKKAGWQVVGGTGAAASLWAAIEADINQSLLAAHVAPFGHAITAIYRLYNTPQLYPPYHDITTGSNLYYTASPGYDLATGVGTPDVWNIVRDLKNEPALSALGLRNGGFEDKGTNWIQHSSGGYDLVSAGNPHTGKYGALFCSYANCHDSITQAVVIPAFVRQLTLTYWVYMGGGNASSTCQDNLQVFFRTAKGDPITTVQKLCNTTVNGWVQYNFDVTQALQTYAGKTVQVVFAATGTSGPRSNFFVNLDDTSLQTLVVAPGITTQLIQNSSFENGHAPWKEASQGGYELISTVFPHTGKYSAYLCGYPNCHDSIMQTVLLPASIRHAVLSYWLYTERSSSLNACTDVFRSYLRLIAENGVIVADIRTICDTDVNGWTLFSFDVTNALATYAGKLMQVDFEAIGSNEGRERFSVVLDDLTLYVTHD